MTLAWAKTIDLTPGWPQTDHGRGGASSISGVDFMAVTDGCGGGSCWQLRWAWNWGRNEDHTWGNALYECFDQKVEEKLIQPTFITMHPVDVSPLAKRSAQGPHD